MRKGKGKEAKLVFMGHALMENRSGMLMDFVVSSATGTAESDAVPVLLDDARQRGFRPKTVGGDKGYDTRQCVKDMRDRGVTPHVAQRAHSAIDGRTTRHPGYGVSQKIRKQIEEIFGWMKTVGGFRRTRYRGVERTGLAGYFVATAYIDGRLSEGLENCVVLLRELRALGYSGGYTILKDYVQPRRRRRQPRATVRFETGPGEQAQVDWGSLAYVAEDGRKRRVWAFVMVLSWSRAIYVEFVRHADVTPFMRCHVNAFEYFGGVPRHCLYDNAKVVVLGRDDAGRPKWNSRMLDFALRVGFEMRLCWPYRAQTKGKLDSVVKSRG